MRFFLIFLLVLSSTLSAKRNSPWLGRWHSEGLANSVIEFYYNDSGQLVSKCISSNSPRNIGKVMIDIFEYDQNRKEFSGILMVWSWYIAIDFVAKFDSQDQVTLTAKKYFLSKDFMLKRLKGAK